ncbi:MAG: RIP metalloprotease RseP [Neisseriaceae bacterium]|nr:RIP metalloprotease RseP [Neisseriaceae bacterium]
MLTLIAFVIAILILVSVHEYGHFLVARACGIKVLRFSIGFGKPFISKKIGNTEWCLAPIPLGGYVKMVDTREGEVSEEDLPYAFDKQPAWKRIAVVVAGPITNLILAIIFFAIVAFQGIVEVRPVVGMVVPDTIAARAGIQDGVEVVSIDEYPVDDFSDMYMQLNMSLSEPEGVTIFAKDKDGQNLKFFINTQQEKKAIKSLILGKESFGIYPDRLTNTVKGIKVNSPAYVAGLRDGDTIVAVEDEELSSPWDITDRIRKSPGRSLNVTYIRNGETHQATVLPESVEEHPDKPLVGKIGTWWAADEEWGNSIRKTHQPTIFESFQIGVKQTVDYSWLTVKFFGKMLVGKASLSHISGPVTIADMAGKTAAAGLKQYIHFLALVSLSLGVLNLFPIPMLDGGHLMFYLIELIRGKPLSDKTQEVGMRIGLTLMLILMLIAFSNDFARLLG